MTSLLPAPTSPLRRAAGTLLRSPLGSVLESLTAPHGVDRYLELLDPMLARDTGRALVTAVHRETADTTTLTLRPRRWDGHAAGQYVQVGVEVDGRRHVRCYSVSSSEHRDDGQLTITVKADPDGTVSPFLVHDARPGLVVDVSSAQGDFALPRRRLDHVLLVSGGSGITPVMSILRTLVDEDAATRITFLHYARTADDVAFADELRDLHAQRHNVDVEIVTTREASTIGRGLTGHLQQAHLDAVLGATSATSATSAPAPTTGLPTLVCGPAGLIDGATAMWDDAGHADLLHVEHFQLTPAAPAEVTEVTGTVGFARTRTTVTNDGRTILEQAEAAGLTPKAGCRMGICHTCIAPKVSGRVRDVRDGRISGCDPADVQICISAPVGDVELDL